MIEADWDDVLARARRRPRRLPAVALALAAVAVAVTPAFGLRGRLPFFDVARSAQPERVWRLTGPPASVTLQLRAAARLTHVDPATLRLVAAGGRGYRRVGLVGGLGPGRTPWLAQSGPGWVGDFFPLFGAIGEADRSVWHLRTPHGWDGWHFPMYGRRDATRASFSYVAFGGSRDAPASWASVVGFARSDVARVVVRTAAGTRRIVRLTGRGGYAYSAVRAADLPLLVAAYDASGRLLGRERLTLLPPTT